MKLWAPAQYCTPGPQALQVAALGNKVMTSFGPSTAIDLEQLAADNEQRFQLYTSLLFTLQSTSILQAT